MSVEISRASPSIPRYGALGMVALPQVWLFQIFLTALAPRGRSAAGLAADRAERSPISQHGSEFSNTNLRIVGIYYVVFIVVDLLAGAGRLPDGAARGLEPVLVAAAAALRLSPDHVLCAWCAPSPRRSRGRFVGWGKLERTGTVKVTYARDLPAH